MVINSKSTKLFRIQEVDLSLIDETHDFRAETFEGNLKEDLEREGLLVEPILRLNPKNPDRFEIIDGHSRIRSLRELGVQRIRAKVFTNLSDADAVFVAVKTSLFRKSLNPMFLARIARAHKLRLRAIAERFGLSESYVSKCNSFNSMPSGVQDALERGKITVDQAYSVVLWQKNFPDIPFTIHVRTCDVCGSKSASQDVREFNICVYCMGRMRSSRDKDIQKLEDSLACGICMSKRRVSMVSLCGGCLSDYKEFVKRKPTQKAL